MFKILEILVIILMLIGNIFPIIANLIVAEGVNVWMLVFNGFVAVGLSFVLYEKLKNYRNSKISRCQ